MLLGLSQHGDCCRLDQNTIACLILSSFSPIRTGQLPKICGDREQGCEFQNVFPWGMGLMSQPFLEIMRLLSCVTHRYVSPFIYAFAFQSQIELALTLGFVKFRHIRQVHE